MSIFKGKNVLVTGGNGLVGRELVELLVNAGAEVTSISMDEDNFDPAWDIEYIRGDLRNFENCLAICRGKDIVFHIAGIKGSPVIVKTKPYVFFTSFLQMNTNMIAAMYYTDIEWGLYTSTVGTYGQAPVFYEDRLWEQNPSKNDWFAGWSKRMGEVQIDAFKEQYGKQNISIIKPVNIYGKYDNHDLRSSTMVPSLIRKVYDAEDTIDVWGNGTSQRDIIHARDVARAAMLMVEKRIEFPVNVGNGKGVPIMKVVETIIKASGKDLKIIFDPTKPTGDDFRVADVSRLKNLGFESTVSLEEGIKETYQWYADNHSYEGRFDPFFTKDFTNLI